MYTYDELNKMSTQELEKIKLAELDRITNNENKRQSLIRSIVFLQSIIDFGGR